MKTKLVIALCAVMSMQFAVAADEVTAPPSQPSIGGSLGTNNGSPENPATSAGQNEVRNNDATQNSTDADGDRPNAPDAHSSQGSTPLPDADVKQSVADCVLVESGDLSRAQAINIINVTAPNIDKIMTQQSEAAEGCFAASSQMINLAFEIPEVTLSWSSLGGLLKKHLQQFLQQKANEVLDKTCQIADQAMLEALEPIQEYLADYATKADELNGIIGNVPLDGVEPSWGGMYDNTLAIINGRIEGSRVQIENSAEKMREINKNIQDMYKNNSEAPRINSQTFDAPNNNGGNRTATSSANPDVFNQQVDIGGTVPLPPPRPTQQNTMNSMTTPPSNNNSGMGGSISNSEQPSNSTANNSQPIPPNPFK